MCELFGSTVRRISAGRGVAQADAFRVSAVSRMGTEEELEVRRRSGKTEFLLPADARCSLGRLRSWMVSFRGGGPFSRRKNERRHS